MQRKLKIILLVVFILISVSVFSFGLWTAINSSKHIEDKNVSTISSSPKYTLNGKINWESHQPYIGDKYGEVTYSSSSAKNNYVVHMYTSGYSGSGTASNGQTFNFKNVSITATITNVKSWHNLNYRSSHKSYKLIRDGQVISSGSLSGTGTVAMYSGNLSNGNYRLEYICKAEVSNSGYYQDNFSYTFVIDNTSPSISIKTMGGQSISSGTITKEQLVVTATDNSSLTLYYKEPNGSFKSHSSNNFYITSSSKNGEWKFYAKDKNNNQSGEVSLVFDNTAPTGDFYTDGGKYSEYYVNRPFSFKANDNIEITKLLMKKPNSSEWVDYKNGSMISDLAGEYKFKAIDKAGGESKEYAIFFDNVAPTIELNVDSNEVYDDIYTSSNDIKFDVNDNVSDDIQVYIKKPNNENFEKFTSQALEQNGKYEYYCVDKVGNESRKSFFILDRSAPTLTVRLGGEVTDKVFVKGENLNFVAIDEYIEKVTIYIKKPNTNSFDIYESGEKLLIDGEYQVYAEDGLKNRSESKSIVLDNEKPSVSIFADGEETHDKYKNANTVSFKAQDSIDLDMYVKLPKSESFTKYSDGVTYSLSGKYEFYAVDKAGNESEKVSIVIDRDIDKVEMQGVVNGVANGNVIISWIDKNIDESAPIDRVLVNGKEYKKGSTIYTVKNGHYKVQVYDMAGNSYEENFVSTKDNIRNKTYNQEWWETYNSSKEKLSFDSLDKAIGFAIAREKGIVETGVWSNPNEWDVGIPMDSIDSENAKLGTFYVYKESGNSSRVVAYFTLERLEQVIREYAESSIEHYYYYEKTPATASEGNSVTIMSDNRKIITSSMTFEKGNKITIDNQVFDGEIFNLEGEHKAVFEDDYGNKIDYTLVIVRKIPVIEYCTEKGEWKEIVLGKKKELYLSNNTSIRIKDDVDSYAMLEVVNKNKEVSKLKKDQIANFDESGKYTINSVNHYGKSLDIHVFISKESEKIEFFTNTQKKKLDIKITKSNDNYVEIESIKIYKKVNQEWILLERDDYDALIQRVKLDYSFRSSGDYKVVVEDNFRKGEFAVSHEHSYTQPNPEFTIKGVLENGITNGDVSIDWKDEIIVDITRNGKPYNYSKGQAIREEGKYTVTIKNYDSYEQKFEFIIDKTNPNLVLDGVENNGKTNKNVAVIVKETGLDITVFVNGNKVDRDFINAVLTKDGAYKIVALDNAGNSTIFEFEIDKTPPKISIENLGEDGTIKGQTSITCDEKNITVKVYLNGEEIEYRLGENLEELGEYRVVVLDSLGNAVEYNFTLVYGLSVVSIVLIIVVIVIGVLIVIFVFSYRKKKLGYVFKKGKENSKKPKHKSEKVKENKDKNQKEN